MENTLSNIEAVVSNIASYAPAEVDLMAMLKFIVIFAVGSMLVSLLGRVVLGKRSSLNHAVSSAMGILFIYAVTIVVYTFNPGNLSKFLSPLPFVSFSGDYLYLLPFLDAELPMICSQVLSMVILAFLVNLLDTFVPKGKKILSWYLYRFVTVLLAMAAHYLATWAFNAFLPGVLVTYAPMILLGILVVMLLLGVLNVILSLVLTVANPVIGAIYSFFFSNIVGKQLTKAVLTTVILCAVVALLEHFGYTIICIASTALGVDIPLIAVLLALWYVIGHVL